MQMTCVLSILYWMSITIKLHILKLLQQVTDTVKNNLQLETKLKEKKKNRAVLFCLQGLWLMSKYK